MTPVCLSFIMIWMHFLKRFKSNFLQFQKHLTSFKTCFLVSPAVDLRTEVVKNLLHNSNLRILMYRAQVNYLYHGPWCELCIQEDSLLTPKRWKVGKLWNSWFKKFNLWRNHSFKTLCSEEKFVASMQTSQKNCNRYVKVTQI